MPAFLSHVRDCREKGCRRRKTRRQGRGRSEWGPVYMLFFFLSLSLLFLTLSTVSLFFFFFFSFPHCCSLSHSHSHAALIHHSFNASSVHSFSQSIITIRQTDDILSDGAATCLLSYLLYCIHSILATTATATTYFTVL